MFTKNEIEYIKFALALNTDSDDLRIETIARLESGQALGPQHYRLILEALRAICPEQGPKKEAVTALCEKIISEMNSRPHGLLS